MLFSSEWLARYVDLPDSHDELAELLTRCGMVVDDMRPYGEGVVFDLDIPSNRVDAMNHYGVAREIATARRVPLRPPEVDATESEPRIDELTSVEIDDLEGCPRYAARLIRGVEIGPSPPWLKRLLEAIGLRPLNNVADVTNFVLWELGHPLHAFDFDRLEGQRIIVRRAAVDEKLVTLDDLERELVASDVVIADAGKAVALAGIMGGSDSRITDDSVNVLLEGAWFDPTAVRATAQRLNMHTDASHRFQRSPAFDGMRAALDRAASLVLELAGGELAAGTIDVYESAPEAATVELRPARLEGLLGIEVEPSDVEEILGRLGFVITPGNRGYRVEVPNYRPDVRREEDLIEEIGRHVGYDRLPATLPVIRSVEEPATDEVLGERRLKSCLAAAGCQEAMSSSLSSAAEQRVFVESAERLVTLGNPISESLAVLRAHLMPGLLTAIGRNLNHGQDSLRLFEVGRCFAGPLTDDGLSERWGLAIALTGERRPPHWNDAPASLDFFDLKGLIERVVEQMAWSPWSWRRGEAYGLDPSTSAILHDVDGPRGWAGRLASEAAAHFDIDADVWVAEIDVDDRLARPQPTPQFRPVPRFPGGVRDVALVVPEKAEYRTVESTARQAAAAGNLPLVDVGLVEVYTGSEIPQGQRGMTLRFTFRADDRTLTSDEIDAGQATLVEALVSELGARQR